MKKLLAPGRLRYLPPLGIALLGLVATVLATYLSYSVYRVRDRDRFDSRVAEVAEDLEGRLENYLVLLRAASAVLEASADRPRERLRRFVETLEVQARYAGVRGIGFTRRVPATEREAFEAAMRSGGEPQFSIWPPSDAPQLHPVVSLEPHDVHGRSVLGYDMAVDPVRRAAMERARDSGLPAASGKTSVVARAPEATGGDDPGDGPAFVLYEPVYRSEQLPSGAEERRSNLVGFVFSTIEAGEFVLGNVSSPRNQQVAFEIFDGTEPSDENLLHRSAPLGAVPPRVAGLTTTRKINMAGRDWTLAFHTTPAFANASRLYVVPFVFGGGLLLSALLFFATRAQSKARDEAERNASALQALLTARRESEARRSAILDSSLDPVVAMDESARITEFNRAAEQAFCLTRASVLGRDLFDTIIPESYREELRAGFASYLLSGTGAALLGQRVEATARRADGTEFAAEVTASELRLDSGREFTAHIRDITERKQYEHRLRLEAETVETLHRIASSFAAKLDLRPLIQDVIDAATSVAGAQYGVFFYSGPMEEGEGGDRDRVFAVAGVSREAFAECPLPRPTALLGPTLAERVVVRVDDVTEDPRHGKNAPYFGLPAGHPEVRSFLALPVVTGAGTMLGMILLGHSLPGRFTERHESFVLAVAAQAAVSLDKASLYRAAQEARRSAELANRAKDEFLATLSHELRTPLTAILGWCQLLTRGKRSEAEIARGLERIESSAQAQTRLISDLLDVSRIVSGKLRLEVQPIDLEPVVEAAIEGIRPAAEAKGVTVRSRLAARSGGPLVVAGDASRLQQVFWNLLSNAVKFTSKGGHIEVELAERDGRSVISVIDDGCGIPVRDLGSIFDRFRQVDSSTTRRSGGLGLGLAIVRHLVELHGGTACAESEGPERGATFRVSLPILAARREQPPAAGEGAVALGADGDGQHVDRLLLGLRLLVVDDDAETRELIKVILEEVGAEVHAAGSVRQAIEALSRGVPDVLVSDIAMPERDGYDLIRYVRALDPREGGAVPALALTAFARGEDSRRALLAGFQMHAAKPIEPDELVAMVASLARRGAAADPTRVSERVS